MPAHSCRSQSGDVVETDIPSRLDRLLWSRWHWFVVIALGVTWILGWIGGYAWRDHQRGIAKVRSPELD